MSPDSNGKKLSLQDFIDALRRHEWRAVRRLLLCLFLPGVPILFERRVLFGLYQVHLWVVVALIFVILLTTEVLSRPQSSPKLPPGEYTRTIRGLVSFGEDDATAFAGMGRGTDISRVVNALLDPQFRFGVLFAESGCGKTSLLRAGVQPVLKSLGYGCYLGDVNNQEDPLSLVARLMSAEVRSLQVRRRTSAALA